MLLDVVDIIGFMSTKEVCIRIHYGFEPCLFVIPGFLFDALMIGIVFCINFCYIWICSDIGTIHMGVAISYIEYSNELYR